MALDIDSALGIHPEALRLRARRAEILASNLANADTPGYKARDIDFKAALSQAQGAVQGTTLARTEPGHMGGVGGVGLPGGPLLYRNPSQPSLDGNTVDVQSEQAAFAENAVHYQASLRFLNDRIKGLLTAIKGE